MCIVPNPSMYMELRLCWSVIVFYGHGMDSQDCKAIEKFIAELPKSKSLNFSVFETSKSEGVTIRLRLDDGKTVNHSVAEGLTGTGKLSQEVQDNIKEFIEVHAAKL